MVGFILAVEGDICLACDSQEWQEVSSETCLWVLFRSLPTFKANDSHHNHSIQSDDLNDKGLVTFYAEDRDEDIIKSSASVTSSLWVLIRVQGPDILGLPEITLSNNECTPSYHSIQFVIL